MVGWLAALLAMAMAWLGDTERADLDRMLELTASSVITASAASFILGQLKVLYLSSLRLCNLAETCLPWSHPRTIKREDRETNSKEL